MQFFTQFRSFCFKVSLQKPPPSNDKPHTDIPLLTVTDMHNNKNHNRRTLVLVHSISSLRIYHNETQGFISVSVKKFAVLSC